MLFTLISTLIAILIQSLVIGTYIFVAFYCILAIPVMATWIKKNIKPTTLIFGFVIGIIGNISYLAYTLPRGEITPIVVLAAFGSTLTGLLIGGVISFFKKTH